MNTVDHFSVFLEELVIFLQINFIKHMNMSYDHLLYFFIIYIIYTSLYTIIAYYFKNTFYSNTVMGENN